MLATYSQITQKGNSLYNTRNFSVSLRLFQKYFLIRKVDSTISYLGKLRCKQLGVYST